jgi:serine/threonine protein kinase
VTDNGGARDTLTKSIDVGAGDPTASFEFSNPNPKPDEEITIDASASTAPAGEIVEYDWDIEYDPDRSVTTSSTGESISRDWGENGRYKIELTVTDNGGARDTLTKSIDVGVTDLSSTPTRTPWPIPTATPTPAPTLTSTLTPTSTQNPTPVTTSSSEPSKGVNSAGATEPTEESNSGVDAEPTQEVNATQPSGDGDTENQPDSIVLLLSLLGLGSLGGYGAWRVGRSGTDSGVTDGLVTAGTKIFETAVELQIKMPSGVESIWENSSRSGGAQEIQVDKNESSNSAVSRAGTYVADRALIADEIPRGPEISVEYDNIINREPIGGGGSADVFKATYPTTGDDLELAIKEPRITGTLLAEKVERVMQEANTWNQLANHSHIVDVVDWDARPVPWIAMEYMDGGHLGDRVGEMGVEQALWTALAITSGVRHAHNKGVAHLDLKPENILFRSVEDAWDVPKVADWGLSRHLLEQSRSIQGLSPQYAAPEQFNTEHASPDDVTDVYQLGAVFYELFTGRPPFTGRPTEVMRAVMDDQPKPPSDIADVPEALDEVVLTALAKNRSERYDDILYLRDALQKLLDERDGLVQ